jgi:hypothetical protein
MPQHLIKTFLLLLVVVSVLMPLHLKAAETLTCSWYMTITPSTTKVNSLDAPIDFVINVKQTKAECNYEFRLVLNSSLKPNENMDPKEFKGKGQYNIDHKVTKSLKQLGLSDPETTVKVRGLLLYGVGAKATYDSSPYVTIAYDKGAVGAPGQTNANTATNTRPPKELYKFDFKIQDGVQGIMARVIRLMLSLIAIISIIFIMLGGFRLLFSQGDQGAVKKGKDTIKWALLGLIVALMSFAIINVVTRFIS